MFPFPEGLLYSLQDREDPLVPNRQVLYHQLGRFSLVLTDSVRRGPQNHHTSRTLIGFLAP